MNVKRDDLYAMPEQNIALSVSLKYTPEQMELIQQGFNLDEKIDERWIAFFEDNTLYFHRSWTGHCIFQAMFDQGKVSTIVVNRQPRQWRSTDNSKDIKMFTDLVKKFLIDRIHSHFR